MVVLRHLHSHTAYMPTLTPLKCVLRMNTTNATVLVAYPSNIAQIKGHI